MSPIAWHTWHDAFAGINGVDRWLEDDGFVVDQGWFEAASRLAIVRERGRNLEAPGAAWSALVKDHPEVRRRMYLLRDLGPYLRALYARLQGIAWIYFQDASTPHASFMFPGLNPFTAIPSDFNWFDNHSYKVVAPAAASTPSRAATPRTRAGTTRA